MPAALEETLLILKTTAVTLSGHHARELGLYGDCNEAALGRVLAAIRG